MLPTPADASYPKPLGGSDEDHGVLSTIKYVLTAGPRNGPRHLLDSNIDWGQDLFYLKDWLDESHPEAKLDRVAYLEFLSAHAEQASRSAVSTIRPTGTDGRPTRDTASIWPHSPAGML